MPAYIDHSVYPDVEVLPEELVTEEQKADYIHRICAAWDFDIYPEAETFHLLRQWKEVFDQYPLDDSPAYHTFRRLFDWEERTPAKNTTVHLTYEILDRLEGRDPDPCLSLV